MHEHNKVRTAELDLLMIMITIQFMIRVCTVHTELVTSGRGSSSFSQATSTVHNACGCGIWTRHGFL